VADTASFSVKVDSNAREVGDSGAQGMEKMRAAMAASTDAVKRASSALKQLKGDTDAVKAAKEQLTAKINSENAKITAGALALHKEGTSYEALAAKAKKASAAKAKAAFLAKKESDKAAAAAKDAAEEAKKESEKGLQDRLKDAKKAIGASTGASLAVGAATLAVTGLVAAVAATVSVVARSAVSLGEWILRSADVARSARLMREAFMGGNAKWAANFGEQVDELSRRVPLAKAKLDELGAGLAKNRIGGQLWVDTLNLVAQAAGALGDSAGAQLQSFIERGRQMNRLQLNPMEMIGSGLDFTDVAKSLAANMKIGIGEAKAALYEGRVKLGDGAKAMRDAIEKKFGGINLRKMMSFDNLVLKLGESFDRLTKDVNLEPILKGAQELMSVFDTKTQSGNALKQIVTIIGSELGVAAGKGTPVLKKFIFGAIIGAQLLTIEYLKVRIALKDAFGDSTVLKNIDVMKVAIIGGRLAFAALHGTLMATNSALTVTAGAVTAISSGFDQIKKTVDDASDAFGGATYKKLGEGIVDGLIDGVKSRVAKLKDVFKEVGNDIKTTFQGSLDMHSPSRVFAEYGRNTVEGYEQGVRGESGSANRAVETMVKTPKGGARGGGGAPVQLVVNINVDGSGNPQATAAAITSGSTIAEITKAVIDACTSAGILVPT
jgi:hypothetical protein